MTITSDPGISQFEMAPVDLYRDIHKGIRAALFGLVSQAGSADASNPDERTALAANVNQVADLLVSHAEHEEGFLDEPVRALSIKDADWTIEQHHELEASLIGLRTRAAEAVDAGGPIQRACLHHLYLDLASFTSAYLAHQDYEERVLMPMLAHSLTIPEILALNGAIIGTIPPEELAYALALMLPAMNVEDRTEILGGMRAEAPPEVFAGVWALAGSVLSPADVAALGARLGVA